MVPNWGQLHVRHRPLPALCLWPCSIPSRCCPSVSFSRRYPQTTLGRTVPHPSLGCLLPPFLPEHLHLLSDPRVEQVRALPSDPTVQLPVPPIPVLPLPLPVLPTPALHLPSKACGQSHLCSPHVLCRLEMSLCNRK